jgi:hypothetical protein
LAVTLNFWRVGVVVVSDVDIAGSVNERTPE